MSALARPPFDSDLEEPLKQAPVTSISKRENLNEVWRVLSDTIPAKTNARWSRDESQRYHYSLPVGQSHLDNLPAKKCP
ncbi:hypothetical protein NA56DRAFT_641328 [Hyaloscypha hepaticicola]|uniref:Uncharacterized protein n=1 Tax=Hyaloscypha hepaticicola TaxID=2082293 RepID=A0A2J6QK28_9HELO|nr:hypothetical protein NA56DRAFT_641328 [Hyaloscypha hepaticicola]